MKTKCKTNGMKMQRGHVKPMCLDLDIDLRSTKSGSHTMWHVTLSSFNTCAKCV